MERAMILTAGSLRIETFKGSRPAFGRTIAHCIFQSHYNIRERFCSTIVWKCEVRLPETGPLNRLLHWTNPLRGMR
jgi:hypothetical protein